jgi:hypothetical protein
VRDHGGVEGALPAARARSPDGHEQEQQGRGRARGPHRGDRREQPERLGARALLERPEAPLGEAVTAGDSARLVKNEQPTNSSGPISNSR